MLKHSLHHTHGITSCSTMQHRRFAVKLRGRINGIWLYRSRPLHPSCRPIVTIVPITVYTKAAPHENHRRDDNVHLQSG